MPNDLFHLRGGCVSLNIALPDATTRVRDLNLRERWLRQVQPVLGRCLISADKHSTQLLHVLSSRVCHRTCACMIPDCGHTPA